MRRERPLEKVVGKGKTGGKTEMKLKKTCNSDLENHEKIMKKAMKFMKNERKKSGFGVSWRG